MCFTFFICRREALGCLLVYFKLYFHSLYLCRKQPAVISEGNNLRFGKSDKTFSSHALIKLSVWFFWIFKTILYTVVNSVEENCNY